MMPMSERVDLRAAAHTKRTEIANHKVTIKSKSFTIDVPTSQRTTLAGRRSTASRWTLWVDEATQGRQAPVHDDSARRPLVMGRHLWQTAPPPAPAGQGPLRLTCPGVVTTISVNVGESIQPGRNSAFEAMKMNNPSVRP
jgi:biotin carboxyl carrier protein